MILIQKQNRLAAVLLAPPRRLELRSSAPEADTLSTELRGRAGGFYHNGDADLSFCQRCQLHHFSAQFLDDLAIPILVAHLCKLFLLVGKFA